jgi:type I restriction enzyme, S subunit
MTSDRTRLRFVAPLRSKTPPHPLSGDIAFLPMEAIGEDGIYDCASVRPAVDIEGSGYTYFEQDDVVRARVTPCFENGKGALLSTLTGGCGLGTTELFVFMPSHQIDGRFLYYATTSHEFTKQGTATLYGAHGVRRVDDQFARDYRIWVPTLARQLAIVDYLDRKTERIDALIAAKQRMVGLLEERFKTQVMDLLFVNSSGGVAPLGRFCSCLAGYTFSSKDFVSDETDAIKLLRGINVSPGSVRWDDVVYLPRSSVDTRINTYSLRAGDLVVGMDRPMIQAGMRVAAIQSSDLPSLLVQRVARLRANSLSTNDFLRYALMSPAFQEHFTPITTGVSVPHISEEQMLSFRLPAMSLSEQATVIAVLRSAEACIIKLRSDLLHQSDLLREHRQAIITAAITGQLGIQEMP